MLQVFNEMKVSRPAVILQDSLELSIRAFDIVRDFLLSFATLVVIFWDCSCIFRDFQAILWGAMLSNGTRHGFLV